MACGSGKTLVALWTAEKKDAQTILVLLPSLALVRQTLHDWAKENSWDDFNYLCVCSDATVIKGIDETVLCQHDLDFPVTTQREVVQQFLNNKNSSRKIIFSTYQSCQIVAQAMPKGFAFDLAIFDEAHKTASREGANYAFALQDTNLPIKKRLFLTATPRHYNVNKRDKEGEQRLVYSMDDETTYGRVAHQLSFRGAVEKDLICDYKVIVSVVTSEEVNRELLKRGEVIVDGDVIKAQRMANIIAAQNAIEKYGTKKIFSFHNSVNAARSFTSNKNEGIGAYLKGFVSLHVNGEMSTSVRDNLLKEFKESERAIISNARCLTEGVNVPAVNMVAFVSPKKSQVDIVQAAGRAMRKSPGKEFGYILIPLFIQLAEDENLEEALEKTKFQTVWDVLQAMQEQDESLVETIAQMREDRGKPLGFNDNRLREKVEILGPELCINELRKSITTKIIDRLGSIWDERFGELVHFKERHGCCDVPAKYPENPYLGTWVSTQRTIYKKGMMPRDRIERLNSIGFSWFCLEDDFKLQYDFLCEFRKIYSYRWPKQEEEFPQGNPLGKWSSWKRSNKKNLESWKIRLLEKINFPWSKHDDFFESRYAHLVEFRRVNPTRWPMNNEEFPKGIRLGTWCDSLRQRYKPNKFGKRNIKESQIKRLDEINFPWNLEEFYWKQQYEYLIVFRSCNQNRWPKKNEIFPEENKLGVWCSTQKDRSKRGTLLDWQIKKLRKIGFSLERDLNEKHKAIWLQQYNYLIEFRRRMNPDEWPKREEQFPNGNNLGSWCKTQRGRVDRLANWKIKKLNEIGFPWVLDLEETRLKNWIKKYNYLAEFRKKYPNRWPKRNEQFPEGHAIGKWCYDQQYRKRQLSEDKINKLKKIGFPWR